MTRVTRLARPLLAGALVLAAAGGALGVALTRDGGPSTTAAPGSAPTPTPLAVSVDKHGCGAPPTSLAAGPVAFAVTDSASTFVTVYLTDPGGDRAYAEIRWLGPRHTLPLTGSLAAGRYALRCVFSDGPVVSSPTLAVTGSASGTLTGYAPMPDLALAGAVASYRAWVQAALPGLLAAAQTLDADVARGDLASARADWLPAHLDYERLGAAYNSFGDFDASIDGRADGLPQGTATSGWTGFFALEQGLWHGAPASALRPLTQHLVSDVQGLIADFPSEDTDPGDLPLRAHEILENGLQFQLSGHADYGSGTTLATLDANVQGTQEVLSLLAPLLRERAPGLLDGVDQQLAQLRVQLAACRTGSASGTSAGSNSGAGADWTPAASLDRDRRERLDGALGALLEQLSEIPNLLAPRTDA
ncbi:EfeM/EfeO family lipoprotein [Streptacidiphilus fuscans]|uniref:EfeM/EfeO family lipoprotein n=1 Tax=Streptacidiphilus fuscans TaxID=2789292 RepID=A0A931FET8_9ACTN|nr:EfeM/EfeO family lipoprotein [Streptacidiphilus fuscans]MBF9069590.1 EfeM/EfeO family lipoprotein [Streptacidiphilus fuscans]